jgi:magnesium chelatase subunit I
MGYPENDELEREIVKSRAQHLDVDYPDELVDFTVGFIRELRYSDKLEKLPSVRATMSLYERAQSNAKLRSSGQVQPRDIWDAVISVLAHRISFKPSVKYLKDPVDFLEEQLQEYAKKRKVTMDKGGDP